MPNEQPKDEWTFLRPEEFSDDAALDAIDRMVERGPEERAMHVEHLVRPVTDPARSEVATGIPPARELPVTYFDDEQPEVPTPPGPESDHEQDIEELLESQHYAFGSDEADGSEG